MAYVGLGLGPLYLDGGGGSGGGTTGPGSPQVLPPIEVSAPDPFAIRPQVQITTRPDLTAPSTVPFPAPFGIPWPVLIGLAAFAVFLATRKR